MKKSKQIRLVLISSFLATCASAYAEDIKEVPHNTGSVGYMESMYALKTGDPDKKSDTTKHHHHSHGGGGHWHGAFKPYSYKYGPHSNRSSKSIRHPGSYPGGGFTPNAKPGVVQGGFGASQTAIAN